MRFFMAMMPVLFVSQAHAQLMDAKLQARLDAALPTISNPVQDDALHGRLPGKRLFYTGNEIPHAHQDLDDMRGRQGFASNAAEMNFRLSSHNYAANKDGKPGTNFEFPWKKPGGTDQSKVFAWKILYLPPGEKVEVFQASRPAFFSGINGGTFVGRGGTWPVYDWRFPLRTRLFEVLSFEDRLKVFEVRVRTKVREGAWRSNTYRPFVTRRDFVEATGYAELPKLKTSELQDYKEHRNLYAHNVSAVFDYIPGFTTSAEVDSLLNRTFHSAIDRFWEGDSTGPTTLSDLSIVPKNYGGAFVGNSQQSCMRCHQDAARHVRDFDARREWYGLVRGSASEKILSFHPVALESLSANGVPRPVKLNLKLVEAGIVDWKK